MIIREIHFYIETMKKIINRLEVIYMEMTSEMAREIMGIQQQYKKGFAIKQENQKTKKEIPTNDITKTQWFWDIAVLS